MRLETGPGLNEVLLEDAQGAPVGLLLGFLIDLDGREHVDWSALDRPGFVAEACHRA